MKRAYFPEKQKAFLKLLRSDAPPLRKLLADSGVKQEEFFSWLRRPAFAREIARTLKRLRKIQSISADLTAFFISDQFAQRLADPETNLEILRKTWQADREVRTKPKSKDKSAAPVQSFVHPDVPADEAAELDEKLGSA